VSGTGGDAVRRSIETVYLAADHPALIHPPHPLAED